MSFLIAVEDTPIDRGPSSGEESNDDDDNELKTICNPGRSCIIMNIFPCGCPPEDPVYDTNQSKTSLTPKRGARKMGRKMRRYAKRGNDKRAKGPDENAEDSPTSRLRSALEICEKKCRARHQKAEDLTIHTFSKRVRIFVHTSTMVVGSSISLNRVRMNCLSQLSSIENFKTLFQDF